MKITTGTETAHGFVRHLRAKTACGKGFDAPVMVKSRLRGEDTKSARVLEPVIEGGRYVYASPGGGRLLG